MGPGEWLALAGLALTVGIASLATWRSAVIRDAKIDEQLASLRRDLDMHSAHDDRQFEIIRARAEEDREKRHQLRTKVQELYAELREDLAALRPRRED